jgi:bis(5'-nucleosyl)-tetraphosphatase (symmetrical)
MSTYAIGDIQGCYKSLNKLLEKINYNPKQDTLWLAGDLVNRGQGSLETLRLLKNTQGNVRISLGNHDIHLITSAYGFRQPSAKDTFDSILNASDKTDLVEWLRHQNFLVSTVINKRKYVMTHAGIPHIWKIRQSRELANEIEKALQSETYAFLYLKNIYGNSPEKWSEDLEGPKRWRCITNYLTRMRFISAQGELNFSHNGKPADAPYGFKPWYEYVKKTIRPDRYILFGHWAALNGETGSSQLIGLDTGCVWHNQLTAYCLENQSFYCVNAQNDRTI